MRDQLIKMLKEQEGTGPKKGGLYMPYQCPADKLTIGWGHNLEANGIPDHIAEQLLKHDVANATIECASKFDWFGELDAVRRDVVVNMVFNMGMPTFNSFKNTIRLIAGGDYVNASIEMLNSRWARQVKGRARVLSEMMKTGAYPQE